MKGDELPPPAPTDVPAGFQIRSHRWLVWLMASVTVFQWGGLLITFNVFGLVIAILLTYVTVMQETWRARVSPAGVSFVSPLGVDWSHAWADLRSPTQIRPPGSMGPLLRARAQTGQRVSVPNGRLTTIAGGEIAPATAQRMIQAWVDAGAPTQDPSPDDLT